MSYRPLGSIILAVILIVCVVFTAPVNAKQATRDVEVYLWDVNSEAKGLGLVAVTRRVTGASVLRLTLQTLFAGPSKEEEAKGLSSSTFGMKFEDVTLKNGVALVKFSQPPNQTNYGSSGPLIFTEAIENTALQFPTVKRVQICAIGDTLIDAQLEKQFPRCRK
jgi:spore germination protein GerM